MVPSIFYSVADLRFREQKSSTTLTCPPFLRKYESIPLVEETSLHLERLLLHCLQSYNPAAMHTSQPQYIKANFNTYKSHAMHTSQLQYIHGHYNTYKPTAVHTSHLQYIQAHSNTYTPTAVHTHTSPL